MDFQSVNLMNMQLNLISGNLFPMTSNNNVRVPIGWKIYSIIAGLMSTATMVSFGIGFIVVPQRKAISEGSIGLVFTAEIFFMVLRIHTHRNLIVKLIQHINDTLRIEDEIMKHVVKASLKLMHTKYFHFYWICNILTVVIWIVMPLPAKLEKTSFRYEDYRLPFAISMQPFSLDIFLLGNLCLIIGCAYVVLIKIAVDIYMLNFVMLMTAQYRYIAIKLQNVFREENSKDKYDHFGKCHLGTDSWAETEIKVICRHYNTVIRMSSMLKDILSPNICLIYITNILRFSFIGVMLINFELLKTFIERLAMFVFFCLEVTHFYILCSNVQKLLDASTEMTDMAFHESWYHFTSSMKRKLMLLMLGNNLKCRIVAFEKFNISLRQFSTIINQSYSIALLCLKFIKTNG